MSEISLYDQFEMDHDKEHNGVWVYPIGTGDAAPAFLIARKGPMNQKYSKALDRITRPYKRLITLNRLPNEKADEIMKQVFAESILLGWRNVTDKQGKLIEFSAANALVVFDLLPDLYFDLEQQASEAALFRLEVAEATEKN